jgi:hypothetical protein
VHSLPVCTEVLSKLFSFCRGREQERRKEWNRRKRRENIEVQIKYTYLINVTWNAYVRFIITAPQTLCFQTNIRKPLVHDVIQWGYSAAVPLGLRNAATDAAIERSGKAVSCRHQSCQIFSLLFWLHFIPPLQLVSHIPFHSIYSTKWNFILHACTQHIPPIPVLLMLFTTVFMTKIMKFLTVCFSPLQLHYLS